MFRARSIFTILFSAFWLMATIAPGFVWNPTSVEAPTSPEQTYAAHIDAGHSVHHQEDLLPSHSHGRLESVAVSSNDDHLCCAFTTSLQMHTSTDTCAVNCTSVCSAVINCLLPVQVLSLQVEGHPQNGQISMAFHPSPAYPPETPPPYILS